MAGADDCDDEEAGPIDANGDGRDDVLLFENNRVDLSERYCYDHRSSGHDSAEGLRLFLAE